MELGRIDSRSPSRLTSESSRQALAALPGCAVIHVRCRRMRHVVERGNGYRVWGRFHDATGPRRQVTRRGSRQQSPSGRSIISRTLEPASRVRITIRIKPGVVLYENAVIEKKAGSVLGDYSLEIDPGTPFVFVGGDRRPMRTLRDGDEIKDVREPTEMAQICRRTRDYPRCRSRKRRPRQPLHALTSGSLTNIANAVDALIAENSELLDDLLARVDAMSAPSAPVVRRSRLRY